MLEFVTPKAIKSILKGEIKENKVFNALGYNYVKTLRQFREIRVTKTEETNSLSKQYDALNTRGKKQYDLWEYRQIKRNDDKTRKRQNEIWL